jgi:hypothetical protein
MSDELDDDGLQWLSELSWSATQARPWKAMIEGHAHFSGDTSIMVGVGDQRGGDAYEPN